VPRRRRPKLKRAAWHASLAQRGGAPPAIVSTRRRRSLTCPSAS
jgi:hypothetical protein